VTKTRLPESIYIINSLLFVSLIPVLIITFYIYYPDNYEKKPFSVLLKALFAGVLIVLPLVIVEKILILFSEDTEGIQCTAFTAFIVAGLTEVC
jgi:protease PrsW